MTLATDRQTIPILMYHSIAEAAAPRFLKFAVAPGTFAEQMALLRARNYTTLTVSQLVAARQAGAALPDKTIVITFDDAFQDFATHAMPVLQRYGMVATLYVPTAFVGGTSAWLAAEGEADRPLMDWRQLNEVAAAGIECGAHSHRHLQLDILSPAVAQAEIARSRQILADQLNRAVTSFAYPFGYYNAIVRRSVIAAGYTSACAVRYQFSLPGDDRFALSRLIVPRAMTIAQFGQLLAGQAATINPTIERARAMAWRCARRYFHADRAH